MTERKPLSVEDLDTYINVCAMSAPGVASAIQRGVDALRAELAEARQNVFAAQVDLNLACFSGNSDSLFAAREHLDAIMQGGPVLHELNLKAELAERDRQVLALREAAIHIPRIMHSYNEENDWPILVHLVAKLEQALADTAAAGKQAELRVVEEFVCRVEAQCKADQQLLDSAEADYDKFYVYFRSVMEVLEAMRRELAGAADTV